MAHNPFVDEEDEMKDLRKESHSGRFKEFDCPSCNANNPTEEFGDGSEIMCHYCGNSFRVKVADGGRLKLREI